MKITTSSKINIKSLANVAQWLIEQRTRPPNKSALINASVESLSLSIHDAGKGQLFETFEDALLYLRDEGYDFIDNSSKRHTKETVSFLSEESLRAAFNEEQQIEAEMALFEKAQQLGKINEGGEKK